MTDGPLRRRRTVLAACAAGVASLAGCGNPLSNPEEDDGTPTQGDGSTGDSSDVRTIRLGGETSGWVGQEPEAISDETNPTLELQPETTYEIVWENLDGAEHELILADGNGDEVEASEESESEGETVSLEFTAGEDLAEYYCEYHPEAMRGEIRIAEDG